MEKWITRILRGLVVLFLLLDGVMHLANPAPVVDAMNRLGIPLGLTLAIGVIELLCTVLYVIPATATFGALLLTGYLGGAVAIHMRAGSPIFEAYIFPVIIGAMIWGGIFPQTRVLLAPRRQVLTRA